MNATRLTLIVLAAAAVMVSGCSTDNRVLGPGSDLQSETGINPLSLPGSDSNDSAPEQKYFVIEAKVQRVDIEGGCWYLEADDGNSYTPLAPKELVLETGLKFKAEGYVDEDIQFFCGNGPAFVIEKYEIISKPESRDTEKSEEFDPGNEKMAYDDGSSNFNTLEGTVDISAAGCILLKTANEDLFVLQHDTDVQLDNGDHVRVTGYLSALPSFTCYEAPVFYAETISVSSSTTETEGSDQAGDDNGSVVTEDDDGNDRFVRNADDSRSQKDFMDMENEQIKKKEIDEEERGQDDGTERP